MQIPFMSCFSDKLQESRPCSIPLNAAICKEDYCHVTQQSVTYNVTGYNYFSLLVFYMQPRAIMLNSTFKLEKKGFQLFYSKYP